jgi:hypothetical protein
VQETVKDHRRLKIRFDASVQQRDSIRSVPD